MTWVPLQDSDLAVSFVSLGAATISGSIVSASASQNASWSIENGTGGALRFRVTALAYELLTEWSDPARFDWTLPSGTAQSVVNLADPGFSPTQFEGMTRPGAVSYAQAGYGEGSAQETYQFLVEVWQGGGCQELGRTTRAYVSGYDRARIHQVRVRRQERRCLVADYNGAIPPSRSIVAAEWRCTSPWVARMEAPVINDREAQVTVDFQLGGFCAIRCTATLDNGEVYSQVFECQVRDSPGFFEDVPINAGSFVVRVEA